MAWVMSCRQSRDDSTPDEVDLSPHSAEMAFWDFRKTPCFFCSFLFSLKGSTTFISVQPLFNNLGSNNWIHQITGRKIMRPIKKAQVSNQYWLNTLALQERPT
uniref:Uncharacterized protein n=1 Tax=Coccidioides posadasii RMSCC 3488 TaxID=454284 RepID=A0A0J6FHK4_COCPO|nr:hypothetical protein CPAG_08915 [Coccidioides posadasii RMSCC 3488]